MLVVFAGLPGAGKTTIARLLAKRLDAIYLRIDTIGAADPWRAYGDDIADVELSRRLRRRRR